MRTENGITLRNKWKDIGQVNTLFRIWLYCKSINIDLTVVCTIEHD